MLILKSTILDYLDKFKTKYKSLVYLENLKHRTGKSRVMYLCKGCNADVNEVCEMATVQIFSFV